MEMMMYLRLLRRWAWLLALGTILGTGVAYYSSSRLTPVYQASAKVLILPGQQVLPAQGENFVDLSSLSGRELLQNYIELLTTQPVVNRTGERLGWNISANQITARRINDTNIVLVTVQDSDPDRAALIANTLVEILIEQNEELQAERFASSEESLRAQLEQVDAQIKDLQNEIVQIAEAQLDSSASVDETQLQMQQFQSQMDRMQAELDEIVETQLVALREGAATISRNQISDLQLAIIRTRQSLTTLDAQLGNLGLAEDPQLDQKQSTLALYQQIYSELLSNYEAVRLSRLRNTTNLVQVEVAMPPQKPIQPQPLRDALLGGAVGLILAGGVAVLIEYLDDTLKTAEDVQHVLGLPVIGLIGKYSASKRDEIGVHVLDHPRSAASEGFRLLRTNIEFASPEQPLKTILLVSDTPGVGKTTLAVNLATVLAQDGRRVILVDADMRRPAIHEYMHVSNRVGLRDVIAGVVDVTEAAHIWRNSDTLAVITSGRLPSNPTDTLTSRKMTHILARLKEQADVVIIDGPPLIVAESSVLASLVDGVIWVLEPGRTHVSAAQSAMSQLVRAEAPVIGAVFNRISPQQAYYFGYRDYSLYYRELERANGEVEDDHRRGDWTPKTENGRRRMVFGKSRRSPDQPPK